MELRHEWFDVARNLDWRFRYVAETDVLPEALTGQVSARPSAGDGWPEVCTTPFRDYVESQRWSDEPPAPPRRWQRVIGPGELDATRSAPAPTPVDTTPAHDPWTARFAAGSAARAVANLGALDEIGRVQSRVLADHHRRRELFRSHLAPELDSLQKAARSMVSRPADADDLVQDTLLRAYRSLGSFDGRHARAWLLTIMRNAAINRSRATQTEVLSDLDAVEIAGPKGAEPEGVVLAATFDAALEAALRLLPRSQREVLEAVDVRGLSYAEAADLLDLRPGTLTSRLSRARAKIHERLRSTTTGPAVATPPVAEC